METAAISAHLIHPQIAQISPIPLQMKPGVRHLNAPGLREARAKALLRREGSRFIHTTMPADPGVNLLRNLRNLRIHPLPDSPGADGGGDGGLAPLVPNSLAIVRTTRHHRGGDGDHRKTLLEIVSGSQPATQMHSPAMDPIKVVKKNSSLRGRGCLARLTA